MTDEDRDEVALRCGVKGQRLAEHSSPSGEDERTHESADGDEGRQDLSTSLLAEYFGEVKGSSQGARVLDLVQRDRGEEADRREDVEDADEDDCEWGCPAKGTERVGTANLVGEVESLS